jgi:ADP-ribose pyrophosphatase YjhB (NUDIX family)
VDHRSYLRRGGGACKVRGSMSVHPVLAPAVSVAILREGRVLLVQRGREPSKGFYAFPGGRVEPGEAMADAARRELFEETALTAGALAPLTTVIVPDRRGVPVFELTVFHGTEVSGRLAPGDDAEAAGWFDAAQMAALPVLDDVSAIAHALLAGRPVPRFTG